MRPWRWFNNLSPVRRDSCGFHFVCTWFVCQSHGSISWLPESILSMWEWRQADVKAMEQPLPNLTAQVTSPATLGTIKVEMKVSTLRLRSCRMLWWVTVMKPALYMHGKQGWAVGKLLHIFIYLPSPVTSLRDRGNSFQAAIMQLITKDECLLSCYCCTLIYLNNSVNFLFLWSFSRCTMQKHFQGPNTQLISVDLICEFVGSPSLTFYQN